MNFQEFVSKSIPTKSVFQRRDFDQVTNVVKWLALRFSFVLYKCGFTANMIDAIGLVVVFLGFALLSTAMNGEKILPLIGIAIIFSHVFLDFIDGPIAKARGECSVIGGLLDNIGCDLDRMALLVLFGIFSQNNFIIIANTFVAALQVIYLPLAKKELPEQGIIGFFSKISFNKYSYLSVRIMLAVVPLLFGAAILADGDIKIISYNISIFYITVTVLWLFITVPHYANISNNSKGSK